MSHLTQFLLPPVLHDFPICLRQEGGALMKVQSASRAPEVRGGDLVVMYLYFSRLFPFSFFTYVF